MAKLFPPLIEGAIPSFYSEGGIVNITIPFSINRVVSPIQVGGFALKVKTIQSSSYLFTKEIKNKNLYNLEDSPQVVCMLTDEEASYLKVGQFYKFQLAYLDLEGNVGYYSTVGTGKFTSKPEVTIAGLEAGIINSHNYEYMGVYNQKGKDTTERVYTYKFDAFDSMGNLIATSGEQLHNSSNDVESYESYDKFILAQDLEIDKSYYIKYTVITNNGMTISSPRYRLMQKISIDPEIKAELKATLNYENGYADIHLIGQKDEEGMEEPVTGAFLLTRSCKENGYTIWEEISRFKLAAQTPSRWLCKDFTAEQGKTYRYALQQYNGKGLYSNKILSNELYMDFEDAFLFDGTRQLKIKYNPKVSSFKTDLLESKIDTIGGKHPFIFRNGRVSYKEFPISGLISYFMDEEHLFMNEDEFIVKEKTTNLISDNLAAERTFKLKVLDWLTNGEPKLFRSPSEGNYIVRLMNTSLTPNDTLGRMLHTFNTTAYEVADFNYQNLNEFDFIQLKDPEVATLRWETIPLFTKNEDGSISYKTGQVNTHPVTTIRLTDMMPGDRVFLYKQAGEPPLEIKIGVTGSYYVDIGVEFTAVVLPDDVKSTGSMTYSYYSIAQNQFDKVDNVTVSEVPVQQFIGQHDIIRDIGYVQMDNGEYQKNPKIDIVEFYVIHASKRSIERAQWNENQKKFSDLPQNPDPFTLFAVGKFVDDEDNDWVDQPGNYFRPGYPNRTFKTEGYIDPASPNVIISVDNYDPCIYINGNQNSLEDTIDFEMNRPGKLDSLIVGNGATVEVAYQIRNIDYSIEDDPNWGVKEIKRTYLDYQKQLDDMLSSDMNPDTYDYEKEVLLRKNVDYWYNEYIRTLIEEQAKEKEAEGKL